MNPLLRKEKQRAPRGAGLYLVLMIMFFLLPIMLVMLRQSMSQNKFSLSDRDIRTAREMAESITNEFMNTFTEDWNRNVLSSMYLGVTNANYQGLGTVSYTSGLSIPQASFQLQTVATYKKGNQKSEKGVEALFHWSNDILKFDLVWPESVTFGVNVDNRLKKMNGNNFNRSLLVNGSLTFAGPFPSTTLGGFIVAYGTVTVPNFNYSVSNARMRCLFYSGLAATNVYQYQSDGALVPNIKFIPPEGNQQNGGLDRYWTNSTVSTAPIGVDRVSLVLGPGDQQTMTFFSGPDIISGPTTTNYFDTVVSGTVPWSLSFRDVDVEVWASSITRPITVSVLGGKVQILGNITYAAPTTTAGATRSFALLAEEDLIMGGPVSPITLDGFYGSTKGSIRIRGNRNVRVRGTLYGPIAEYEPASIKNFDVRASTALLAYPPPHFPRRPRVIMWDYVP